MSTEQARYNNRMISMAFKKAYQALNAEQRKAVDSVDGPVMVIAGPGTGKTRVLTMRIGKILHEGLSPADGILCLTFTNTGVREMRERLVKIMGADAARVSVSTFHSFAMRLLEEFFEELGMETSPKLLDDADKVLLYDELLENHEWKKLRRRNGGEHNFEDLKSLISLLKRERVSPDNFLAAVAADITRLKEDPANVSSRGKTKGGLKSDVSAKLEAFERTKEAGAFYDLYEKTKTERNLADYEDILEMIVALARKSELFRATLRERYLYIVVDEHQDSSGVQNEFLEAVWAGVEKPNVFVVGDDRQLIYGFGGASLSHFEKFSQTFPGTKRIALTKNYRSTQTILDVAECLLKSTLVKGGLTSSIKESYPVSLVEAEYQRDEIIRAGMEIRKKIAEGVPANECAVLMPKQAQVRTATAILKDLGLPVADSGKTAFFALPETQSLIGFLSALNSPFEPRLLVRLVLDPIFGVPFLDAHRFIKEHGRKLSADHFQAGVKEIQMLGQIFAALSKNAGTKDVYGFVQEVASELFFKNNFGERDHRKLLTDIEVVRTMLHLALSSIEKNPKLSLSEFLTFLARMETYGEDIPLAVFSVGQGVEVLTLHGSKGREFDFVWVAHMDESSLMRGKRSGISLPELLKEKVMKKDEQTAKRELYVAITRAKRFCTLSYARSNYSGSDQKLASIIDELPKELWKIAMAVETESEILASDKLAYVLSNRVEIPENAKNEIAALVKEHFPDISVSVSLLNNFWSCPWKWYFRNFLRLPETKTESLIFGDFIHGSIEHLITEKISSEKVLASILEDRLDELRVYDEAERRRFLKDGKGILARFMKNSALELFGAKSEESIRAKRDPDFSKIEISGKIDIVKDLPDGTLLVVDFKTGRVKKKSEIEKTTDEGRMSDMLRQLAMYSYLLRFDPKTPAISRSRLMFLEAEEGDVNARYETSIDSKHIDLLRKDLKDYVALLENGKWIGLPCDFKPYGRNKECEYCALAKRFNA